MYLNTGVLTSFSVIQPQWEKMEQYVDLFYLFFPSKTEQKGTEMEQAWIFV